MGNMTRWNFSISEKPNKRRLRNYLEIQLNQAVCICIFLFVPGKIINKGINDWDSKHVGYLAGLLVLYYLKKNIEFSNFEIEN